MIWFRSSLLPLLPLQTAEQNLSKTSFPHINLWFTFYTSGTTTNENCLEQVIHDSIMMGNSNLFYTLNSRFMWILELSNFVVRFINTFGVHMIIVKVLVYFVWIFKFLDLVQHWTDMSVPFFETVGLECWNPLLCSNMIGCFPLFCNNRTGGTIVGTHFAQQGHVILWM
jgi:hypothetical protein